MTDVKDYIIAALSIALVAAGLGLTVQSARLKAEKAEHKAFVAQTAAAGKVAEAINTARIKEGKDKKEKADEKNTRDLAALRADNKRLRDERASSNYLPAVRPGARSPETITFDRADLERAIQQLATGVSELLDKGDEARVNLDTAKRWAQ